ncbi:unnamed protein product [Brassicogethes aeneus]|uniref:Uncharacterized protein n=1 Tax=Brassicogethes aeneus TaxID=1431903 RepID=A0A9P0FMP6_BRAAE|nr:unnamed protein product [Brassicogethes aeneus]
MDAWVGVCVTGICAPSSGPAKLFKPRRHRKHETQVRAESDAICCRIMEATATRVFIATDNVTTQTIDADLNLINLMFGVVPYLVVSLVVVVIMALLVMAALNYHCSITWRWLKYKACGKRGDIEESEPNIINLNQTSVQISHSLPDLQAEAIQPIMHDIKETTTKKASSIFALNIGQKSLLIDRFLV